MPAPTGPPRGDGGKDVDVGEAHRVMPPTTLQEEIRTGQRHDGSEQPQPARRVEAHGATRGTSDTSAVHPDDLGGPREWPVTFTAAPTGIAEIAATRTITAPRRLRPGPGGRPRRRGGPCPRR